ncbi:MAG TPA: superoxide dismutase [Micromonosporaceae bacterium]|nr:superoxide dismutase [Micromonosporaceae bacterium]
MRGLQRIMAAGLTALAVVTATQVSSGTAAAAHPHGPRPVLLWATSTDVPVGSAAFVYDNRLVPPGAELGVVSQSKRRTRTLLAVTGLLPWRAYGAHLHVNPCGALPAAAGPHYQQVVDPVQPSTNPAFANAGNEVWLDLLTDARGSARSFSVNPWRYHTPPRSLVLHASATATHPGHAGTAGARVACLTLTAAP